MFYQHIAVSLDGMVNEVMEDLGTNESNSLLTKQKLQVVHALNDAIGYARTIADIEDPEEDDESW